MIAAETTVTPDFQRYQDMRWCANSWFVDYCEICDCEQVFVSGGLGLVACCLGCGDARVNSEVA